MAVLFADPGGEYYFSLLMAGAITAGVWNENNGFSLVSTGPAGRLAASDGKVYALSASAGTQLVGKYFANNYGHLIQGYALYTTSSGWSAGQVMLAFTNGNAIGTSQCDARVADASGHLEITRAGTVLGSASTQALTPGWHYVELDATFATTATGTADLWVDGVRWVHATSVQTATTVATANRAYFACAIGNQQTYMKDMYVLDGSTGPSTVPLGDATVFVKYPNAAGVNQQWTPNASTQVSRVQDGITHTGTWPDGDTSYLSDATPGDISDFAHETLSAGTIYGVIHASYARGDLGTAPLQQVCISGGTVETSPAIAAGGTYAYYFDVLEKDPNTGSAWTVANFNNATFGVIIPGQPEEYFWANPVVPVAAKNFVSLPLGDPDEIIG